MDVGELLSYTPSRPAEGDPGKTRSLGEAGRRKRRQQVAYEGSDLSEVDAILSAAKGGKSKESGVPSKVRRRAEEVEAEAAAAAAAAAAASAADAAALQEAKKAEILRLLEEEPEAEPLDEVSLKKMILSMEKKILKNQEMRIKYPENPEKFMESEVELHDVLQELHVVATAPELYSIIIDLNSVSSLIGLLAHENTDVAIATVNLLQEMTDTDAGDANADADEDSEKSPAQLGAAALVDTLIENQIVAILVQNMERLDETVKEESDGVHNSLGIVENMAESRPSMVTEAANEGLMAWLLKRLKAKIPFDENKLYSSEILAILLQNADDNRRLLGETDGVDILLGQLAPFKRHDPSNAQETEMMENLFNALCSALLFTPNRAKFLKGEGLQLMNLMLREKKMSRGPALKVLSYAMNGPEGKDNCNKFVDILGLRTVYPLFMKTPKSCKKSGGEDQHIEHVVSILGSLLRNCSTGQRQRVLLKFTESDFEKIDRLMELHFAFHDRIKIVDERIEAEKFRMRRRGEDVDDEDVEEDFYLQRLEGGLFTLQLIDYIVLEISSSNTPSIKSRILQLLALHGGSVKSIRHVMREYASHIGAGDDAKGDDDDDDRDDDVDDGEREQRRILQLVDKF